jgi:NAD(P)-dependent dehydrogenase (short-subunit alcohol dehydrogenase family)
VLDSAAIVTGGGGGVGGATGEVLAADGHRIVLADIDLSTANEAAEAINRQYGESAAIAIEADVVDESSISRLARIFHEVADRDRVDVVVERCG